MSEKVTKSAVPWKDEAIPATLAPLTHCKTVGEFFEIFQPGDWVDTITVNPKPADTSAVVDSGGVKDRKSFLYGAIQVACGDFEVLTLNRHVKAYDRNVAIAHGVGMELVYGNWTRFDWVKAQESLTESIDAPHKEAIRKHIAINVLLSGQTVILDTRRTTTDENLGLYLADLLEMTLENVILERDLRFEQRAQNQADYRRAQQDNRPGGAPALDTSSIIANVDGMSIDLVAHGLQAYEIMKKNGVAPDRAKFNPDKPSSRNYFALMVAQGATLTKIT